MEGFRSLKEGEAVEFTFKKSSKGFESQRVTGPGGIHCVGSERRPKGKKVQKRRSKGDRSAWVHWEGTERQFMLVICEAGAQHIQVIFKIKSNQKKIQASLVASRLIKTGL